MTQVHGVDGKKKVGYGQYSVKSFNLHVFMQCQKVNLTGVWRPHPKYTAKYFLVINKLKSEERTEIFLIFWSFQSFGK